MNFFKSVFQSRKPEEEQQGRVAPSAKVARLSVEEQPRKKKPGSFSRSFSGNSNHSPEQQKQQKSKSSDAPKERRRVKKSKQREISKVNLSSPHKSSLREVNKSSTDGQNSAVEVPTRSFDLERRETQPSKPSGKKKGSTETLDRTMEGGEKPTKTVDETKPAEGGHKPTKIKLPRKKIHQPSEETNTDFEKVAAPVRPAIARNREKRSAAAMMAKTQAKMAKEGLPVDATAESSSVDTADENDDSGNT